ncbi:endonuclease domain-containing protein [Mucilaginibacter sp. X5P1]|uniref:endonuclease domain-containing protein n=1 Tax=Mucilaginibacter sp. X5P1 TaxID=2723088 RepID=UPI0016191D6F|nr:endonuclease domain-containing protein [Mucilaginibacter sp. X5P1]
MPSITELCRELRKRQTSAEILLWQQPRNRELSNMKFLRQHPIYIKSIQGKMLFYIPDFYCAEAKLVIETDGPVHQFKQQYDKNCDEVLAALGLRILRFENEDILRDCELVLRKINAML